MADAASFAALMDELYGPDPDELEEPDSDARLVAAVSEVAARLDVVMGQLAAMVEMLTLTHARVVEEMARLAGARERQVVRDEMGLIVGVRDVPLSG